MWRGKTRATKQQFAAAAVLAFKVIIEKSRGEMSLLGQDTIENGFFKVSYIFDISKCATNYRDIFEVKTYS